MALVPEDTSGFQDPAYWKAFYENHENAFECVSLNYVLLIEKDMFGIHIRGIAEEHQDLAAKEIQINVQKYGDFNSFGHVLSKYLKPSDKILQIGCGNSELADQLYDNGFRTINSIDIDKGVIEKQIAKNNTVRPELQFSCSSATKIDSPSESYNVILDKGTLDALLSSTKKKALKKVEKMFSEVCRLLTFGGRYIVLSLAQKQILDVYISYFMERKDFIIRFEKNNDSGWKFPLPVFLFIATKLRVSLAAPYMEIIPSVDQRAVKFVCKEDLIIAISAEQEFSRFCHMCTKKLKEEVSITLYAKDGNPRYFITVHDDQEVDELKSYAVFITPVGRDRDWIFATEKGRSSLQKQCSKDRLAVVTLYRDQKYDDMGQIKGELRPYVIQLTPPTLIRTRGPSIEFLSLGKVDAKNTRASGNSDIVGPWTVEDVSIHNLVYRRLVFLSSQNVIQSEAVLNRNKSGRDAVDLNVLVSEYHIAMLTSLPFILNPGEKLNQFTKSRLLILGLGGGALPSFLRRKFPSMSIVVVELDPKIVQVAQDWFALQCDSNLTVVIRDALEYIDELVQQEDASNLFDAIFIDAAGETQENGLSCPLPSLITDDALKKMYKALTDRGVLAFNLVTRNDEVADEVKKRILSIFSFYYMHKSVHDINQVLICPKKRRNKWDLQKSCTHFKKDKGTLGSLYLNTSALNIFKGRSIDMMNVL